MLTSLIHDHKYHSEATQTLLTGTASVSINPVGFQSSTQVISAMMPVSATSKKLPHGPYFIYNVANDNTGADGMVSSRLLDDTSVDNALEPPVVCVIMRLFQAQF